MIISGIQKTSLIDYPGKICTILFTRGCNFSCGFCHNPELVIPEKFLKSIPNEEILAFLSSRKKIIDAVCITGGEPTIHKDLPEFIKKIKLMGYLIKLDTNGTNYNMLKKLIDDKLVDFVAMDIKNSLAKYKQTTTRNINLDQIKKSINIIIAQAPDYEFRTTIVPSLHEKKDIIEIGKLLQDAKKISLQQFRPQKTLNPDFQNLPSTTYKTLENFSKILKRYIKNVEVRSYE